MCNINILLKLNNKDVRSFIQSVTSYSFNNNNDGEGFYIDSNNISFKSKDKINYFKHINKSNISNSKIIITHQRLSTSGFNVRYNHPFINKDFVIVHNGILNQFKKDEHSDTYGFFNEFNKKFDKLYLKNKDRTNSIIKTIEELFKEDIGSYSIFIYDKITKKSYYFKDNSTTISFFKSKNYLYISTSCNNQNCLSLLNEKFIEYDIKSRVIYQIFNNKVYNLKKLNKDFSLKIETKKTNDLTDYIDDLDEYIIYNNKNFDDLTTCEKCKKEISDNVYLLNEKLLCKNCIKDLLIDIKINNLTYENQNKINNITYYN